MTWVNVVPALVKFSASGILTHRATKGVPFQVPASSLILFLLPAYVLPGVLSLSLLPSISLSSAVAMV